MMFHMGNENHRAFRFLELLWWLKGHRIQSKNALKFGYNSCHSKSAVMILSVGTGIDMLFNALVRIMVGLGHQGACLGGLCMRIANVGPECLHESLFDSL
jgi:hypothetical protein